MVALALWLLRETHDQGAASLNPGTGYYLGMGNCSKMARLKKTVLNNQKEAGDGA